MPKKSVLDVVMSIDQLPRPLDAYLVDFRRHIHVVAHADDDWRYMMFDRAGKLVFGSKALDKLAAWQKFILEAADKVGVIAQRPRREEQ